jgi:hypothetical protein
MHTTNKKLYLSSYESATKDGYLSYCIAQILGKTTDVCMENVPDFSSINVPKFVEQLCEYNFQKQNIDTIIQYIPIDLLEVHQGYKNIVIYNPDHFITRKPSIQNKISLFDEIWVWDKNYKIFLSEIVDEKKIKIVGYPHDSMLLTDPIDITQHDNLSSNDKIINYYTVIDLSQIQNLENLIFNFLATFYKTSNVKLSIFVDNSCNSDTEKPVQKILQNITDNMVFINKSLINQLVTIISGNPWMDKASYVKFHKDGDCYINIDYRTNNHVLLAHEMSKFCISICDISDILFFDPKYLIQTYRSSFRNFVNYSQSYFNEFNLYPNILDESIKEKLVLIYNTLMNKNIENDCYLKFNPRGIFDDNCF